MYTKLVEILRCLSCGNSPLQLAEHAAVIELNGQPAVVNGTVICSKCYTSYPVNDGILNFLPKNAPDISIGQWTNHNPVVAWGYERLWRKKALTLLGGREWPPQEELATINRMLQPASDNDLPAFNGTVYFLDQGCSTVFYGRAIIAALQSGSLKIGNQQGQVVALDNSMDMLKEARKFIEKDGYEGYISLVRASAEDMPFTDGAFGGIANGGSLNEFKHTERALAETYRTLAPHGNAAFMVQMHATNKVGGAINDFIESTSGIHFFPNETLNQFYRQAKFQIAEQETSGLITISRLEK